MVVKDRTGRRVGEVKELQSGDQAAFDAHGSRVGTWSAKDDVTRDAHGRRYGSGNQLAALICLKG